MTLISALKMLKKKPVAFETGFLNKDAKYRVPMSQII